jgi:hypothetical protein
VKRQIPILAIILAAIALSSCKHDKDDEPIPTPDAVLPAWTAIRVDGFDGLSHDLQCEASYESISVSINGRTEKTKAVIVASDCDWLSISGDTLAADSIVPLATTTNTTRQRRNATIIFTDADDPKLSASIEITQLSASDNDDNGSTAAADLYVGYGYDIYKALESPMAVRTTAPIIDIAALRKRNTAARYDVIQDCRLSRTQVRYVASNDIHAHGENLTVLQTNNTTDHIEGCRKNCMAANDVLDQSNGRLEQQYIGHGTLEKAVAARVIDRAALLDLQKKADVPFTNDYINRLLIIRKKSGNQRAQLIEQTLIDYGTHLIIQAALGGRIDYTFTMQKTSSFNSVQEMEDEINYTLGRIDNADRKTSAKSVSSSKSKKGAIEIRGGSTTTRQRLESDISKLSPSAQLDPAHITDWLATINYSADPGRDPNLDVIHFELIPMWDLVWNDLKSDFRDATLRLVQRSDCGLPSSFLGTDIYEFSPQKEAKLFNFANIDENSSLCRLLYYDDYPILQVCNEYVPKIRTDARVTIVYPIYKQQIRLNQGIFVGDGIHQPSYVGFSGGDCYVYPIDGTAPGDYIEKFWYVNGSLLISNPTGIDGLAGKRKVIRDDYLIFYTNDEFGAKTHNHPIVKVGSNFWTRHDIDHHMLFAEKDNGAGTDQFADGILFTMFQYKPNLEFTGYNGWTWGYEPNTYFDANTKWFLPTEDEVKGLYQFIGFNPKSLFKGEASGWEAGFNGYYGWSDIQNQNKFFSPKVETQRYKNELNVISSNNASDYSNACLMVLDKNYTLRLIDNNSVKSAFYRVQWRSNFYPVRPVRGFMYQYPLLSTITKNVR